jgi:cephalosporin-C deacetylase-like acetyl esterase
MVRQALDVLEALPEVAVERIGVIGHSLGGHSGMFTAVFEPHIKAIVSSCGFTTFRTAAATGTGPEPHP